jgi:hypothetical protein
MSEAKTRASPRKLSHSVPIQTAFPSISKEKEKEREKKPAKKSESAIKASSSPRSSFLAKLTKVKLGSKTVKQSDTSSGKAKTLEKPAFPHPTKKKSASTEKEPLPRAYTAAVKSKTVSLVAQESVSDSSIHVT